MINLGQLNDIRTGKNNAEDRYIRDRHMYIQGRQGLEEEDVDIQCERDESCYNMGYAARKWVTLHETYLDRARIIPYTQDRR